MYSIAFLKDQHMCPMLSASKIDHLKNILCTQNTYLRWLSEYLSDDEVLNALFYDQCFLNCGL